MPRRRWCAFSRSIPGASKAHPILVAQVGVAVADLAQVGVAVADLAPYAWEGRAIEAHRAQIREMTRMREFRRAASLALRPHVSQKLRRTYLLCGYKPSSLTQAINQAMCHVDIAEVTGL